MVDTIETPTTSFSQDQFLASLGELEQRYTAIDRYSFYGQLGKNVAQAMSRGWGSLLGGMRSLTGTGQEQYLDEARKLAEQTANAKTPLAMMDAADNTYNFSGYVADQLDAQQNPQAAKQVREGASSQFTSACTEILTSNQYRRAQVDQILAEYEGREAAISSERVGKLRLNIERNLEMQGLADLPTETKARVMAANLRCVQLGEQQARLKDAVGLEADDREYLEFKLKEQIKEAKADLSQALGHRTVGERFEGRMDGGKLGAKLGGMAGVGAVWGWAATRPGIGKKLIAGAVALAATPVAWMAGAAIGGTGGAVVGPFLYNRFANLFPQSVTDKFTALRHGTVGRQMKSGTLADKMLRQGQQMYTDTKAARFTVAPDGKARDDYAASPAAATTAPATPAPASPAPAAPAQTAAAPTEVGDNGYRGNAAALAASKALLASGITSFGGEAAVPGSLASAPAAVVPRVKSSQTELVN